VFERARGPERGFLDDQIHSKRLQGQHARAGDDAAQKLCRHRAGAQNPKSACIRDRSHEIWPGDHRHARGYQRQAHRILFREKQFAHLELSQLLARQQRPGVGSAVRQNAARLAHDARLAAHADSARSAWMPVFSTATVPVRQKFEAWRHVITQQFLPLRPEPVPSAQFWGEVGGGALDSISIARVRASGQVVHRAGREMSQSSPDALFVNVHVAGVSALECGVNAHRMSQGDLFFVNGQRPFRLHCEEPMHHVVAAIPMDRLRAVLRRPDLAAGAMIQRGSGIAALLSDYLISVAGGYEKLDISSAAIAARHVVELVAHTLNERHAGLPLPRDAVLAALYARACQIIEQDLGDPLLSPARIAKRLNVSVRFLHALYRGHGKSLMRQVCERRVQCAAAMLKDEAYAHRSITDIAMSCGFSDLTHFGRVFSQAYQETPRNYRARSH